MVAGVYAARGTGAAGVFTDALGTAEALKMHGQVYGDLFAIVLFDASIIGAAAVTLSTSYAFGDVFNMKHSLHRSFKDAKPFYATYSAMIVVAAGIVLIPGVPLGLLTTSVQALAGILLPSAACFLLLLCNDREVLGPWVNPRWLNILAAFIVGVLRPALRHAGHHDVVLARERGADRELAGRRVRCRRAGRGGVDVAHPVPQAATETAPSALDVRGRPVQLADAAAGPAQARAMVARHQARHGNAPRLPGGLGTPAGRQSGPDRLTRIGARYDLNVTQ